jgi:Flp pilus assembly protein TadG
MQSVSRARHDRGATALELAFIAPSLLVLIFFIIQAALYFYGRSVAQQAAREGVSQIRLSQTRQACQDQLSVVTQHVQDFATDVGREALLGPKATPSCAAYDQGQVSVTVHGKAISLVPGLTLTVTQKAFGAVERFQCDGC